MDIMVDGTKTAQIATLLIERDIPYTIAVPDLNAILNKEQNATTVLKTQNKRKTKTDFLQISPHIGV